MTKLIDIVLFLVAIAISIPIAVLAIEVIAAVWHRQTNSSDTSSPRPEITVLIPAHNEAAGIGSTLLSLKPQLTDRDRLIVIADNCDDDTASIARQHGATVIERQDSDRRGKGYALDFGLRFLESNPPEVVVMVDADCLVGEGAIDRIARRAAVSGNPVQATYLLAPPADPSLKDRISSLAFKVKNLVRSQGLAVLGMPCLLAGTGMAFPWAVIASAPLASGNIVEDMQLGIDLAIAGYPPRFCADAQVTGAFPELKSASLEQRKRWEHGHLQTLLQQVPRLLKESLTQRSGQLLAIALDLCVPPLSLLVFLWVASFGVALLAAVLGASWLPSLVLAIAGLLLLAAIITAWAKFARQDLPLLQLLAVPLYILWKIPLYLTFLFKPQTNWIRTKRNASP
jgi:cellulose synthase/poly-beta-1,6-N-acetylglucosamine synthase-like glycosyltransferase